MPIEISIINFIFNFKYLGAYNQIIKYRYNYCNLISPHMTNELQNVTTENVQINFFDIVYMTHYITLHWLHEHRGDIKMLFFSLYANRTMQLQ